MTIAYVEEHGSGKLVAGEKGLTGERKYRIDNYSDSADFIVELCGTWFVAGGRIVRQQPRQFASGSSLYCIGATAEGVGNISMNAFGVCDYDGGARITAQFATKEMNREEEEEEDPDDDTIATYVTEELDIAGEVLVLNKKDEDGEDNWFWQPSGDSASHEGGPEIKTVVPNIEWKLTVHEASRLDDDTIESLVGKVNSDTFLGRPAGTVLYLGASASRELRADGTKPWKIVHNFQRKREGHNFFYRAGRSPLWQEIWSINSEPVFEEASFAALAALITGTA